MKISRTWVASAIAIACSSVLVAQNPIAPPAQNSVAQNQQKLDNATSGSGSANWISWSTTLLTNKPKSSLRTSGQPEEVAPAFVFFASNADSSYISGEVLSVLGGETTA